MIYAARDLVGFYVYDAQGRPRITLAVAGGDLVGLQLIGEAADISMTGRSLASISLSHGPTVGGRISLDMRDSLPSVRLSGPGNRTLFQAP